MTERPDHKHARLAHNWVLAGAPDVPAETIRESLRPAVRAVPGAIAVRLGTCRIELVQRLEQPELSSRWTRSAAGLEIVVALAETEPHDAALEVLTCLGQALWDQARAGETEEFLELLRQEILAGVPGAIDEPELEEKRRLLAGRESAGNAELLLRYARAAFAGTVAEYVHALWHDVTVRTGPDYLPPDCLRRRLQWIARRFPPDRGYKLFPAP